MNKLGILFLGVLLAMGVSAVRASNLSYDAAAGLSVPLTSGYDLGFGGEVTTALDLHSGLSLTGTVGYYTHDVSNSTQSYTDYWGDVYTETGSLASLEVMIGLKYAIGDGPVKPYIFAQGGISDLMNNVTYSYSDTVTTDYATGTSASEVDPEVAGGIGLNIGLGDTSRFSLIVQSKVAAVFATGSTFTYLPIVVGVNY